MQVHGEQRMHFLGRERTELKVERVANRERKREREREREREVEEQECELMASRECTSWGGRGQN